MSMLRSCASLASLTFAINIARFRKPKVFDLAEIRRVGTIDDAPSNPCPDLLQR